MPAKMFFLLIKSKTEDIIKNTGRKTKVNSCVVKAKEPPRFSTVNIIINKKLPYCQ